MKNIAKSIRTMLALLLVCALSASVVACGDEQTNTQISIDLLPSAYTISGGVSEDYITFAVSVTNSENKEYTLVADHEELVKIEDNKLYVIADTTSNVNVTVTATSKADTSVTASKVITVEANVAESVNGNVTLSVGTINPTNQKKATVLRPGGTIKLDVTVTNEDNDDTSYTVTVGDPDFGTGLVSYDPETGYLTTTGKYIKTDENGNTTEVSLSTNTDITVTVTSNADSKVSKSVIIKVKPESIDSASGKLTSAMLREIANDNITVSGTFTDVYGTTKTTYEYEIQMSQTKEDDEVTAAAWSGSWNVEGSKNVQSVIYKLGENGYLNEAYINKNNVATYKVVKDSDSQPLTWNNQHYWNHLGDFANNVSKFVLDDEYDAGGLTAYRYNAEYGTIEFDTSSWSNVYKPSEDDYLLKYVSWSMNPALEEQFYDFYVILNAEETAIERIEAATYANAIYETDSDGYATETITGYYYTTAVMNFSGIGTTLVTDPAPYENDPQDQAMFDIFSNAITKAQNMTNYAFKTVETSMYSPSLDPDDYDISGTTTDSTDTSSSSSSSSSHGTYDGTIKSKFYLSTSGDVGYLGVVTADAILINETSKYESSMDDYLYRTEPYGYKQNTDGTYDAFEYKNGTLTGTRKKAGNIMSLVPDFDIAPEIFTWDTMSKVDGKRTYTFTLRDTAIIREVAESLCLSDFARYASGSTSTAFTVTVDENANITNVKFAYDILGIYGGAYETVYTNYGTAALPEGTFDGYVARTIPTSWSAYTDVKVYVPSGTNDDGTTKFEQQTMTGAAAIEQMFGAEIAEKFPSPSVFSTIFDDNVNGPWCDYERAGTDADGNEIIQYSLELTMSSDNYDENSKITDLSEKIDALTLALSKLGFSIDTGNCDGTPNSSRYIVAYASEANGLQIRVENNNTRYFWVTFYKYGEYKTNKA